MASVDGKVLNSSANFDSAAASTNIATLETEMNAIDGRQLNSNVDVDTAGATANLLAFQMISTSLDGDDIHQDVDVDTGGAIASIGALIGAETALQGSMTATGIIAQAHIGMWGLYAAAAGGAAAALVPVLGGLSAVGAMGTAAAGGLGLVGGAVYVMAQGLYDGGAAMDALSAAASTLGAGMVQALGPASVQIGQLGVDAVNVATQYIPQLGTAATATVGSMSAVFAGLLGWLSQSGDGFTYLSTIIAGIDPIMAALSGTISAVFGGLITIFSTAMPFAIQLADAIQNIAIAFFQWTQSAEGQSQITAALEAAVPVFQALWDMVVRVGGALLQFSVENGPAMATVLTEITDGVVAVVQIIGALIDAVRGIQSGIAVADTALATFGSTISTAVGTAVQWVIDTFNTLPGSVAGAITSFGTSVYEGISSALSTAVGAVSGFIGQVGAAFSSGFGTVVSTVSSVFTSVYTTVSTILGQIVAFVSPWISMFIQIFVVGLALLIGTVALTLEGLVTLFTTIFTGIQTVLSTVWTTITAIVTPIIQAMVTAWQTIFTTWWTAMQTMWTTIQTVFSTVWTTVSSIVSPIIQTMVTAWTTIFTTWWAAVQAIWTTVQEVFTTVWTTISEAVTPVIQAMVDAWSTIFTTAVSTIQSIMQTVYDAVATVWQTIYDAVAPIVQSIWDTITTAFQGIYDTVSSLVQQVSDFVTSTWQAIYDTLAPIVQSIVDAISTAWTTVSDTTTSVYTAISDFLSTTWDTIYTTISDLVTQIVDWITTNWDTISSYTTDIFNTVLTTITDIWTSILDFINTTVDTIVTAVQGAWDSIVSGVAGFATAFYDAVYNAFATAVNKGLDIIAGLLQAMSDALTGFGLDDLGTGAMAQTVLGYKFEDGGTAFAKGGMGTAGKRNRIHVWNEGMGSEAYVAQRGPKQANKRYTETAASWFGGTVMWHDEGGLAGVGHFCDGGTMGARCSCNGSLFDNFQSGGMQPGLYKYESQTKPQEPKYHTEVYQSSGEPLNVSYHEVIPGTKGTSSNDNGNGSNGNGSNGNGSNGQPEITQKTGSSSGSGSTGTGTSPQPTNNPPGMDAKKAGEADPYNYSGGYYLGWDLLTGGTGYVDVSQTVFANDALTGMGSWNAANGPQLVEGTDIAIIDNPIAGEAGQTNPEGSIYMNPDSVTPDTPNGLAAMTHELGHALGLDHNYDYSIMNYDYLYTLGGYPTDVDLGLVAAITGGTPTTTGDGTTGNGTTGGGGTTTTPTQPTVTTVDSSNKQNLEFKRSWKNEEVPSYFENCMGDCDNVTFTHAAEGMLNDPRVNIPRGQHGEDAAGILNAALKRKHTPESIAGMPVKYHQLGDTSYTWTPEVEAIKDRIYSAIGGCAEPNTYYGHSYRAGCTDDESIDWWGGGRGGQIDDACAQQIIPLAENEPLFTYWIYNGTLSDVGPWPDDPHYDHVHTSFCGGDAASGGLICKSIKAAFKAAADLAISAAQALVPDMGVDSLGSLADYGIDKGGHAIADWIYEQLPACGGSGSGGSGSCSQQVDPAIQQLGLSDAYRQPTLDIIQRESGDNPSIQNLEGSGATGCMQFMPDSFENFKEPGCDDITDPMCNVLAGLKFQEYYGGPGKFFDLGGRVPGTGPQSAVVHGGERVLTAGQNTTFERLVNSITLGGNTLPGMGAGPNVRGAGAGSNVNIHQTFDVAKMGSDVTPEQVQQAARDGANAAIRELPGTRHGVRRRSG